MPVQAIYLYFYHGTSLAHARRLMTMDLSPMVVPDYAALDWWEYTDFGKGFYTHPEENKRKAVEWAKKKYQEWGVVRFSLTTQEFKGIPGTPLHFHNKRSHRPANAPALFGPRPANWIEFVEYNRGIRTSAQRPKDNDWTPNYPWMRGPIWGRADSRMPGGGPPLPDHIQQINWGRAGLVALNTDAAKKRRTLFNKDNEHLLDLPPRGPRINYTVPGVFNIIAQPSNMTCWATVGAMMMSWRDQQCYSIDTAMSNCGTKWATMFANGQGLPASEHAQFANATGMTYEPLMCYPAETWEQMLRSYGPLAVVTANPFHARIMVGITEDGAAAGTTVDLIDPAGGRRYPLNFAAFTQAFEGVASSPRFQAWHY